MIRHLEKVRMRNLLFAGALLWLTLLLGGCNPASHSPEPNSLLNKVIPDGTKIDDLDLIGIPFSDAPIMIENWAKDKLEEKRVLLYNNTEIPVALSEIGIEVKRPM